MDYSSMEVEDFVRLILARRDLTPCLLIGKYVNAFKRQYSGTIERAYSLSDVRHLIEEYEGISSVKSGVLVAEGIGYLSPVGQNALLKFIEESKLPLIFLSYDDNVIDTIRSRMKLVMKKWYPVKKLEFQDIKNAQSSIDDKKKDQTFKGNAEIQYMADNCPRLYAIKCSAGDPFDFNNKRMINLMSMKVKV